MNHVPQKGQAEPRVPAPRLPFQPPRRTEYQLWWTQLQALIQVTLLHTAFRLRRGGLCLPPWHANNLCSHAEQRGGSSVWHAEGPTHKPHTSTWESTPWTLAQRFPISFLPCHPRTFNRRQTHLSPRMQALPTQGVLARAAAHLGKPPEEVVGHGDVDVKTERLEDADLHGDELFPFVGIIADVQKVIDTGWASLLGGGGKRRQGSGGLSATHAVPGDTVTDQRQRSLPRQDRQTRWIVLCS